MNGIAKKLEALALQWEREATSELRCARMTRQTQADGWRMGALLVEHGALIKDQHAAKLRKLVARLPEHAQ